MFWFLRGIGASLPVQKLIITRGNIMKYIVGGFIIIVGGLLWWASPQYSIGVSPANLTIPQNTTKTFTVKLMYKPWFTRQFKPISGTINVAAPRTLVTVNPSDTSTNSAGGRVATITVAGAAQGVGKIFVNGTSRKGVHDTAEVSFTVTGS